MNVVQSFAAVSLFAASQVASAAIMFTDFASFDADTTTSLIESFDGITTFENGASFSSFTSNGNTYTTHAGPLLVLGNADNFFDGSLSGTNVLAANGQEDFTVSFGTASTAIGFETYFNALGPLHVQLFGASGLLDSFAPNPGLSQGFLGFTSAEAITSMRITATGGQIKNIGIDNLVQGDVNVASVTTPAVMSLFALGLALIGRRHKRS